MAKGTKASEEEKIKALAHTRRQRIIGVMLRRERGPAASPSAIARELGDSLSNISYHVRVLADREVIRLEETRPVRGSLQHFYRLEPEFMALPWAPAVLASFVADAEQRFGQRD